MFPSGEAGREPIHLACDACAVDPDRAKMRHKYFCVHCGLFCKKDKFERDHEGFHLPRAAPGRGGDRSRKWQPAHAALVQARDPKTDGERGAVLDELHQMGATEVDMRQLKRKLERLRTKKRQEQQRAAQAQAQEQAQQAQPQPPGAPGGEPPAMADASGLAAAALGVPVGDVAAVAAAAAAVAGGVFNAHTAGVAADAALAAADEAAADEEALPPKKRARGGNVRKATPPAPAPAPAPAPDVPAA